MLRKEAGAEGDGVIVHSAQFTVHSFRSKAFRRSARPFRFRTKFTVHKVLALASQQVGAMRL